MTLHEAYQKVLQAFGNDVHATLKWFATPIFELKQKSPNYWIERNRQQKVIEYVKKYF